MNWLPFRRLAGFRGLAAFTSIGRGSMAAKAGRPSPLPPHPCRMQLSLEPLEARTTLDVSASVGPNINISPFPGTGAEATNAVNPTDPQDSCAPSTDATT